MEDLFKVLEKVKPGVDFRNNNNLIDDEFDVQITAKDILPENFNSAEAIYKLVQKLLEE